MLHLGPLCDPSTLAPTNTPATLHPDDLTRHAVCVGMTGSGKTGLCLQLLEEIARQGVPILAIDPKGDLGNLALQFGALSVALLAPWIEDPAGTAERWRQGLAEDGRTEADMKAWNDRTARRVLTPGSEAGVPVDVTQAPPLTSFAWRGGSVGRGSRGGQNRGGLDGHTRCPRARASIWVQQGAPQPR